DRRLVLDARIGAGPRRFGDVAPEVARAERLDHLARGTRTSLPRRLGGDGAHEVVAHADGVVRVLAADRMVGIAVEVRRIARSDERKRFLLLADLPPDEIDDLWVIHVEANHLRGSARGSAALRRAGSAIEHLEEAHQARARPAARQLLLLAAN